MKNMKKLFEEPKLDALKFGDADVLTSSIESYNLETPQEVTAENMGMM